MPEHCHYLGRLDKVEDKIKAIQPSCLHEMKQFTNSWDINVSEIDI